MFETINIIENYKSIGGELPMPQKANKDIALKSFFLGPQAENALWLERNIANILRRWFEWRKKLNPEDGKVITPKDQISHGFLSNQRKIDILLDQLSTRLEEEVPQHSPRYIGHMFSEISLPALIGHIITLLHNPNNISSESSRVSVLLEKEAVKLLMEMIGFNAEKGLGHFTSGGTVANIEAMYRAKKRLDLWIRSSKKLNPASVFEDAAIGWKEAQRLYDKNQMHWDTTREKNHLKKNSTSATHPTPSEYSQKISKNLDLKNFSDSKKDLEELAYSKFYRQHVDPVILVPSSYHYSWPKGASLLGLSSDALWPIELDKFARMSTRDLEKKIELAHKSQRPIAMVASIVGTTELGAMDPVQEIQEVLDKWSKKGIHLWHHVDAAYGGFFSSLKKLKGSALSEKSHQTLHAMAKATSITIDPHKLGYVPYSSGAILIQEKLDYYLASQNPPYIQFDFNIDPGPFTIEGSRSAGGAVATWLCGHSIGFDENGYGRLLNRTIRTRKKLEQRIKKNKNIAVVSSPETNVLCFSIIHKSKSLKESNKWIESYIKRVSKEDNFYVSQTSLSLSKYKKLAQEFINKNSLKEDAEKIQCVRLCLMNPFLSSKESHSDFIEEFAIKLEKFISKS